MKLVQKLLLICVFTASVFALQSTKVQAIGKIFHAFYLQLPNGKTMELKGVKIHHSKLISNDEAHDSGIEIPGVPNPIDGSTAIIGRAVQDYCLTSTEKPGYSCYVVDSCYAEDIGGPYIPASYAAHGRVDNTKDASYKNFNSEDFLTMIQSEAPYLVNLYDPSSIRGFQNAHWQGKIDAESGSGLTILNQDIGTPHSNYPLTPDRRLTNTTGWNNVNGFSGSQSWGAGELYKNNIGGNIIHGQISWMLVPPDDTSKETPTGGFSGACQQKACPAQVSYSIRISDIKPINITSDKTMAHFYISFFGASWNSEQKSAVKAFLGTPDFSAGTDFGYYIGSASNLGSDNGKPFLDFQWSGSQTIGTAGKTLNALVAWTGQRKAASKGVPGYAVGSNLTINGGVSKNDSVGGTVFSLLPDECDSCNNQGSQTPATGTVGGAIIACTATAPQTQSFSLFNIDLKGNTLEKITFYLKLNYSATTAKLIGENGQAGFLGEPQMSQWATEGRSERRNGDWFYYTLASYSQYSGEGSIVFRWDDGVTFANGKTLSDLITYGLANGISYVTVGADIQTKTANGALLTSGNLGSVYTELKAACPGNQCPAGEEGPPNAAKILLPASLDDTLKVTANREATISWTQANPTNSKGHVVDEYEVLLYPTTAYATPQEASTAAANNATNIIRISQVAGKNTSTIYTRLIQLPVAITDTITIAIKSINNLPIGCAVGDQTNNEGGNAGTGDGGNNPGTGGNNSDDPWTTDENITLSSIFAGNFYKADSCSVAGATPIALNSSSFVMVTKDDSGEEYTATATGSNYSAEVPPGGADYFPKLKIDQGGQPETLVCSSCNPDTGDGFCHRTRTAGPTTDANFFLQSYNLSFVTSWWQARNGLVYGHDGIKSALPITDAGAKNKACVDAGDYCQPTLVRRDFSGAEKTAGVPMTFGSFVGVNGWWTDRADQPHTNNGSDNKTKVVREDYNYFASKVQMPNADMSGTISSLSQIPAGTEQHGAKISYAAGDLHFEPDATWAIGAGEKRVIFVNGNLTITQHTDQPVTTVQEGGFLAFIVSGSITFDPSVGHVNANETTPNTSIDPNITAVFIANGQITVASKGTDDKKFVGAGTFVGWSGINLKRTFDNGSLGVFRNTTTPSETFIYRPDFVTNIPDALQFTDLVWQQVN